MNRPEVKFICQDIKNVAQKALKIFENGINISDSDGVQKI